MPGRLIEGYITAGTKRAFEKSVIQLQTVSKAGRSQRDIIDMERKNDWKKRPLLTAEQLRIMQSPRKAPKLSLSPREEFERLFRRLPASAEA